MKTTSLHHYIEKIPDHRVQRTQKHPLINIILITLCAVIAGAEDWQAIVRYGHSKLEWLEQYLDLKNGIPSHDTFNRFFSLLDSRLFERVFIEWVKSIATKIKGVVALDGKAMKGTREDEPWSALHIVNAWCVENQLALGQCKVTDKSNEITAIPVLLSLLEVEGSIVTTDAMGCQKEISHVIRDKGAHYVLALKGNHGLLHDDVRYYFESLEAKGQLDKLAHGGSIEKGHGRIEQRNYWATDDIEWLERAGWRDLTSIVMVKSQRDIKGNPSAENRYFLSSLAAKDIQKIAKATREHWQVESAPQAQKQEVMYELKAFATAL